MIALYSTFLQRAVDQVIHDVAIAKLPVVFCIDRAGCVGADGVTHHGLFDIALLRNIPNLTIAQPKDEDDLKDLLAEALRRDGPTVIRYPRGGASAFDKASAVACALGGVCASAVHARYLKPFDFAALERERKSGKIIVSIEDGVVNGGFGEAIGADMRFGWPDEFIPNGEVSQLEKHYHLDVDSIVEAIVSESSRFSSTSTSNPKYIIYG